MSLIDRSREGVNGKSDRNPWRLAGTNRGEGLHALLKRTSEKTKKELRISRLHPLTLGKEGETNKPVNPKATMRQGVPKGFLHPKMTGREEGIKNKKRRREKSEIANGSDQSLPSSSKRGRRCLTRANKRSEEDW